MRAPIHAAEITSAYSYSFSSNRLFQSTSYVRSPTHLRTHCLANSLSYGRQSLTDFARSACMPVAELPDEAEAAEFQQRDRIAPILQLAAVEVTHVRIDPAQGVAQTQLVKQAKKGEIRFAQEVVIPLDLQPIEIEARGHAADAVVALVKVDLMAGLEQFHRRHQPHGACAEYDEMSSCFAHG